MAVDLYAPCPCGSGKKFKWCCVDIWGQIEKVYETFSNGQAETALIQMREIQKAHPENPEVYGRTAELLMLGGDLAGAEKELEKAFKVNPSYPFGYYLQAALRIEEGEWEGALILLRKAAQNYPADSKEDITRVYNLIFRCEMNRNRPIAARAALKIAVRYAAPESGAKELLEQFSGPESRMPKVAKDDLELLPCGVKMESAEGEEPRLGDLPELFRKCIRENPADINARYNLGVALAWLGNNKESIATLDEFIRESNDPNLFRRAATLVEVLKFSAGMENESDYINYHLGVPLSNPETVGTWLNELQQTRRILPLFQDKQTGSITFFMLEESASGLITTGSTAKEFSKVIGYLALYPATLVAWSYDAKKIENLKLELLTKLQVPLNQVITSTNISDFAGILLPSAVIPLGTKDKDKARKIAHDQMVAYFDNTWLSLPRKSLGGKTPSDAASDAFLGKKLQGLLDLYEEVVATQDASLFSFDDLRKKLNLGGTPQLSSENSPVKTENTSGGPQSLDGHLDAFRKALTAEDKAQAFENANSAINLGIAPSHPSYVPVVRFLADYHAEQQNVNGMKSLLTKAIADSTGEGLETQANDLKVLEIKMLGKCKDVDGLKLLLESFLSKPSEEDKLFVAFAETCMRINLKDQARKVCEEGMKMAKSRNKGDLCGFFEDMLQSLNRK